ncbi:aliphatic sulfonate ABC transporter substrate-binding protein [uncultured Devosia sp.]|uniref:aliphatic sulfonate ABC transporter substrate-binding protein n=1 Tax=uncultured Devosia sp. TaxID=211434 RepID=UPI0035CC9509
MFTRRQTFQLFAGAATVLALPASAWAQDDARQLRIGWQKGGVFALAKKSGAIEARLAPRGVSVTWAEFTSGPPLLEALGANALDFGSTGDVPPLFAQAAGGDLVYVAATPSSLDGSAILVKQDSPIKTLADLKGKKIAFKRGSSAHNFIVKALRIAGLTLDDVTPLDLGPPDAAPAFANNQVDAWVIWDPYYAIAAQDAQTRVLTTTEGVLNSYGFLQANGSYARQNPTIVAEVIDALRKVGQGAQADLDGTAVGVSEMTGVPVPITRITLGRKGADLGAIVPLNDEIIAGQQALADEFFGLKIVPRQLTVSDIVWYPPAL